MYRYRDDGVASTSCFSSGPVITAMAQVLKSIRMKNRLLLAFLIVFSYPVSANGMEPDGPLRLNSLQFVGVHAVPKKELAAGLVVQAPPVWKLWLKSPVFTRDDLHDDLLRIRQFYQGRGYYQTEVEFQIKPVEDRKDPTPPAQGDTPLAVNVTFTIIEGPPVRVEFIDITVSPQVQKPAVSDLLDALPLKVGQVFETAVYQEAKKVLLKELGNYGYPFADLAARVTIHTDIQLARVFLNITAQKQYVFGPVQISPHDSGVRDIVIQRAFTFKEGELYVADKVDESRRNLFNLDMFRLAVIKPEKPELDAEAVPMTVQLETKKRQNFRWGVGYGTEDGFRVSGAWTYRNPWGWAGKASISAKRSDLIENIHADYVQPYFLDEKNTLRSKVGFEREKQESFTNRKVFGNIGFERILARYWTMACGYNLETNDLEDIKITDPKELALHSRENIYFISSLLIGLTFNSSDDLLDPRKGNAASLTLEWASGVLGSEISFIRPALELRRYQPLFERITLAGRVCIESVYSDDRDSVPIFKRLFLGGSNTMRGYDFQKVPPLDANGRPLGGLSSVNANLEVRFPVYQELTGVVFGDMGFLGPDYFRYDIGDKLYSCGAGIRYKTLIGPLRLDFGYQLNPPENMPQSERWRIHFSIGQAF